MSGTCENGHSQSQLIDEPSFQALAKHLKPATTHRKAGHQQVWFSIPCRLDPRSADWHVRHERMALNGFVVKAYKNMFTTRRVGTLKENRYHLTLGIRILALILGILLRPSPRAVLDSPVEGSNLRSGVILRTWSIVRVRQERLYCTAVWLCQGNFAAAHEANKHQHMDTRASYKALD